MPMLVDQMARWSATRDARSLVKLDQTINLRTIAAMVGSVNLSGAPAMSLDIMLKKNHPLMKPLAGPPLKTELPGPLPADTALVARFGVGDPKAAWHAFGQVLEAIDPVLALNLKKLRMSIDHKFGASAWQKVAPALGGEAMFFAVKKPESANDVGLIATAKDEAALKALTDLVGQAPAVQKLAMTQEDIGGIVLNHPEKVDVFPCYARIDGLLLLTARRALARAAIDAHIEKKGPAAEEINAALKRLQPASMLLLAKADALELARKDRLKPGSWMAAGLTIAPDRLTLSLSDPALFLPAIEILSEESKKKAQRQIADCKRRLREVGKAVLVATAADPQLCYPRTFAKVLENGEVKDKSIFRCPMDPNPNNRDGVAVSYEFVFDLVNSRIKLDLPMNCLVAWDKKGNHPGNRCVVYVSGKSEMVSEERFLQLLVMTTKMAKKYSAKTVKLPE